MDAEDRALGSHVYMVWMWGLWPHLCSALDVLRLAGELPSHSEKYISKLSELEPKSRTIIFCCVCVTHLLAELVVTRGGKLTDRAKRRQRLHKAQTQKYFLSYGHFRFTLSLILKRIQEQYSVMELFLYANNPPVGYYFSEVLSFPWVENPDFPKTCLLQMSLLSHRGLCGDWWFLYALLSCPETTLFYILKTHL